MEEDSDRVIEHDLVNTSHNSTPAAANRAGQLAWKNSTLSLRALDQFGSNLLEIGLSRLLVVKSPALASAMVANLEMNE